MTTGHLCALGTAVSWAAGVIFFKRSGEHFDPLGLNYFKGVVALLLLLPTLPLAGVALFPQAPTRDVVLLLVSGVVGIALADTLFLRCLALLGAARTAIVDCLYGPFVVLASVAWLGERPGAGDLLGGLLVVSAVFLTQVRQISLDLPRAVLWRGIGLGASAMAATALAIVAVKPILPLYPVLWATAVRLLGGVGGLTALALLHGPSRSAFGTLVPQRAWRFALPGAILGTYLALVLWVAGFKYAAATEVAILNQTSTLFIVALAALFLREPFTAWHALAAALAFLGAAVVVW